MKSPWTNPNKKKMKNTTSMGIKPADANTLREVDVDVVAAFDKWLNIGTPPVDLLHVGKVGGNWFRDVITLGSWLMDKVMKLVYISSFP